MAKQTFKTPLNFEIVDTGSLEDNILVRTNDGDIKEVSFSSIPSESSSELLGDLINDNFNREALGSDYTISGTASWSVINNKLRVSGGASSSVFTNTCFNTAKLTNSENFTARMRFKFNQITATDYGLSFMLQSVGQAYKYSFYMVLNLSSDANKGKLSVYSSTSANGSSATLLITTTRALALTIGDEIEYCIIRKGNLYIFEAKNNNTNDSVSYFLDSSLAINFEATKIVNNVCKIGFSKQDSSTSTATYDISYLNVHRDLIKNRKFLFIGDSITFGYESGTLKDRWPDLVFSLNKIQNMHTVYALPGNVSSDYNQNIIELQEFTCQYAVLMLGINEAQTAVSLPAFQAEFSTLIENIVAQDKTPIICLIIPHPNSTIDARIVSYNNWIISNYGGTHLVVDTYHPLKSISYSGPHPLLDGHKILSMVVFDKIRSLI